MQSCYTALVWTLSYAKLTLGTNARARGAQTTFFFNLFWLLLVPGALRATAVHQRSPHLTTKWHWVAVVCGCSDEQKCYKRQTATLAAHIEARISGQTARPISPACHETFCAQGTFPLVQTNEPAWRMWLANATDDFDSNDGSAADAGLYYNLTISWGTGSEDNCAYQCTCNPATNSGCGGQGKCGWYIWNEATKLCQLFTGIRNASSNVGLVENPFSAISTVSAYLPEAICHDGTGSFRSPRPTPTLQSPWCIVENSHKPHSPHNMTEPFAWEDDPRRPFITALPDGIEIRAKLPTSRGTDDYWETMRGYYNDIQKLDREFEVFLGTVNRYFPHAEGVTRSVTIFYSDHGGGIYAKWSCYDAGLRIPFYAQFKGFPAIGTQHRQVNQLASLFDVLPTLLDLAAIPMPDVNDTLAGKSLVPLLQKATANQPLHKYVFGMHTTRGVRCTVNPFAIRSAYDGRWKYIRNYNEYRNKTYPFQINMLNSRTNQNAWAYWDRMASGSGPRAYWGDFLACRPREELYDLDADPDELYSVAHLAIMNATKLRLAAALDKWMADAGDSDPALMEMAVSSRTHKMLENQSLQCLHDKPSTTISFGPPGADGSQRMCPQNTASHPAPHSCFRPLSTGRIKATLRFDTSIQASFENCEARCASLVGCTAFAWKHPWTKVGAAPQTHTSGESTGNTGTVPKERREDSNVTLTLIPMKWRLDDPTHMSLSAGNSSSVERGIADDALAGGATDASAGQQCDISLDNGGVARLGRGLSRRKNQPNTKRGYYT